MKWFFFLCGMLWFAPVRGFGQGAILRNGGFEGGAGGDGKGGGVPNWQPYASGYDVDRNTHRNGEQAIRCDSANTTTKRGAQTALTLNQTVPAPIIITGWSRADSVGGVRNGDYALYVDLEYTDGTTLWGLTAPFRTGTHDWERRQLTVLPQKPIKTLTLYVLFRGHSGTAWFDDLYARELKGANLFDSQPIAPPTRRAGSGKALHIAGKDGLSLDWSAQGDLVGVKSGETDLTSNAAGGFFARDVAADGPLTALRGGAKVRKAGGINVECANGDVRITFNARIVAEGDSLSIDAECTDVTKTDRALTIYFALPVDALGWQWGQDIRTAETLVAGREVTNQTHVNVGATGGMSLYPYASISNGKHGIGFANQMDWPNVSRIFYNGTTKQFVIAWDIALTGKTATWPSFNARMRCTLFRIPPALAGWGFRAATQKFYALNKDAYTRRAKADGIWMPFTDPARIQHPEDFGIAYHEGDNSLASDDALHILSFRYTEPATYWLPMPPEIPRTYADTMALIEKNANGSAGSTGDNARAVLNSGTQDEDGHYNLEFRNEPWNNGAVFLLNPNPELPVTPDKPTKGSLAYSFAQAMKMYGKAGANSGVQDGEYLDSLEGWADTLDFRPSHLQTSPYPIPFDTDTRRPVFPLWYAVHTFTRYLSNDLHNRDKLLFANSVPVRFAIFAPLLDVMGIEVNWLDGRGGWQPDDDATLNFRRTMSGKKPYLLLMNTDYSKLTPALVEKYFQRSLFYGIFPSMFSANAADHPYWEDPKLYNRDRPLFKKYIPLIKTVSAAGWEPITYARSSTSGIAIERFGTHYFTVQNTGPDAVKAELTFDVRALGFGANVRVRSLLTGEENPPVGLAGNTLHWNIALEKEGVALLEIR